MTAMSALPLDLDELLLVDILKSELQMHGFGVAGIDHR